MPLDEDSQNHAAFTTPMNLYKWKILPMGLASASESFQNLMDLILSGLSYEIALVYLDDIIIFGRTTDENIEKLKLILCRLKEAGLRIKGSKSRIKGLKSRFFQKKIHFLRHTLSNNGVEVDPQKINAAEHMKCPHNIKQLRTVLGLNGFYKKFIEGFGKERNHSTNCLKRVENFSY